METIKDVYIMLPSIMEDNLPKVIKTDVEIIKKYDECKKYGLARYSFGKYKYEFTYYFDKPFFSTHIYLLNEYDEYIKPSYHSINVYISKELLIDDYKRTLDNIECKLQKTKKDLDDSINAIKEQKRLLELNGNKIFD